MELFDDLMLNISSIGWIPSLCFGLGLLLVLVEAFAPGFGVAGASGIILLVIGVILTANTVTQALLMLFGIVILVGIIIAIIFRSAQKGRLSKTLVLSDSMKKEFGYTSADNLECYIGREGIALTTLRPAGTVGFDEIKLDVVSDSEFIPKGTKVKIIKVVGSRIVVREINNDKVLNKSH